MTRVMVTGATGFLGAHVLAALSAHADVEVIAAARSPHRVPEWFPGEIRAGDLTDPAYRATVLQGIDVVLHAGTWSTFWGHARQERRLFLEPTLDFLDCAVAAGVSRVAVANTVAVSTPAAPGDTVPDDAPAVRCGFWPHLDALAAVERHMERVAGDTQMMSMRLGHFIGAGNSLGLVPALIPRLKTGLVPWIDHGRAHMPLVSGDDMGRAFAQVAVAPSEHAFESINVVGPEQPTMREVFGFIATHADVNPPRYSVPRRAAMAFARVMEAAHPLTPARAPFLTRSLVHVAQNWHAETAAATRLGIEPTTAWQDAVLESIDERRATGFAWPLLAQSAAPVAAK